MKSAIHSTLFCVAVFLAVLLAACKNETVPSKSVEETLHVASVETPDYYGQTCSYDADSLYEIWPEGDGYLLSTSYGVYRIDNSFHRTDVSDMEQIYVISLRKDGRLQIVDGEDGYEIRAKDGTIFPVKSRIGSAPIQLIQVANSIWLCDGSALYRNGVVLELPRDADYYWEARALIETQDGLFACLSRLDAASYKPISGVLLLLDGTETSLTPEHGLALPAELLDAKPCCPPETGLIVSAGKLWRLSGDCFSPVADLNHCGVNSANLLRVLMPDFSTILCLEKRSLLVLDSREQAAETGQHDPVESKTLLIGTIGEYPTFSEFISYFNRTHTEWKFDKKVYTDAEALNRGLLTGEIDFVGDSDLLLLNNYGEKGLLQDYTISAPEMIQSDSLYQNMINGLRTDGKLYCLPGLLVPCVSLMPSRYCVESDTFNSLSALTVFLEEKEPEALRETTKEAMFSRWFEASLQHWIDFDNHTACFDSSEFIALLRFCNQCAQTPEEASAFQKNGSDSEAENTLFQLDHQLRYSYAAAFNYQYFSLPFPELSTIRLDAFFYLAAAADTDGGAVRAVMETVLFDEGWHRYIRTQSSFSNAIESVFLNREWTEADQTQRTEEYLSSSVIVPEAEVIFLASMETVDCLLKETNRFLNVSTSLDFVYSEAQAFFNGDCTAEEAARRIQNRVEIYLAERG